MAKVDIKGTKADNTLTIEGEGANETPGGIATDADAQARMSKPVRDPCQKFGHRPSAETCMDGDGARVCRFCNTPF